MGRRADRFGARQAVFPRRIARLAVIGALGFARPPRHARLGIVRAGAMNVAIAPARIDMRSCVDEGAAALSRFAPGLCAMAGSRGAPLWLTLWFMSLIGVIVARRGVLATRRGVIEDGAMQVRREVSRWCLLRMAGDRPFWCR